ncbi:helix-turn-helix transcriptional regulator [Sphingobacterium spiritivorum]|uniref:helix-turn-helix transcriptional regulator n=1 Tax=Sphingobacterium spiritivorum TaxID=258 RepID=UPI003DA46E36
MHKKIKDLRHSLRLTQQQFADKLGTNRAVIAQVETGRNNPTSDLMQSIYDVFGFDIIKDVIEYNKSYNNSYNKRADSNTNGDGNSNSIYEKSKVKLELLDLQLLYSDNMKFLYTLCNILRKLDYKFSKKEQKELLFYEDLEHIIDDLRFGKEPLTVELLDKLSRIIRSSLFSEVNKYMHLVLAKLGIEDPEFEFNVLFQPLNKTVL